MAEYTTLVRSICESITGHSASEGFSKIDEIIDDAVPLIFDFDYPIFDNAYKPGLEHKILHHYYMREIGTETYGQWKLFLAQKLREIMPLYNELYRSQLILIGLDPLTDVNYSKTIEHDGEDTDTEGGTTRTAGSDTNSGHDINTQTYTDYQTEYEPRTKYTTRKSDTPQGGLTGIENNQYLSEATITDASGKDTTTVNGEIENDLQHGLSTASDHTTTHGKTLTKSYDSLITERIRGKMGSTDYATLITNYRNAFLNIDRMILDDLECCFMMIY